MVWDSCKTSYIWVATKVMACFVKLSPNEAMLSHGQYVDKHSQLDVWPNPHLGSFPQGSGWTCKKHLKQPPRCLNQSIWEQEDAAAEISLWFHLSILVGFWGICNPYITGLYFIYNPTNWGELMLMWRDHSSILSVQTLFFLHDWRETIIIFLLAGAGAKTPQN